MPCGIFSPSQQSIRKSFIKSIACSLQPAPFAAKALLLSFEHRVSVFIFSGTPEIFVAENGDTDRLRSFSDLWYDDVILRLRGVHSVS